MWGYQYDFERVYETPEERRQDEAYRDALGWLWRIVQLVGDGTTTEAFVGRVGRNTEIVEDLNDAIGVLTKLRDELEVTP